tara:strand:- start:11478 stop:14069 length:2592 start_codon:yes stop_codon:yes gene_type:complete
MEFKKAIKRIVALGTGASMVGATLFGAMAADLAQYPNQFIQDGKFTGVLVVGDKAAAEDVIGVSDIAVSLQFAATTPAEASAASEAASGDAWKVGTSTKILEISEDLADSAGNKRETLRNITTFIDDSELDALASGTISNGKGDAPYDQYFYLLGPGTDRTIESGYVVYLEDDADVTADFLYFKTGTEIGRYLLEFTTALESDVDDSAGAAATTGLYLTDMEDIDVELFGKSYTIVQARRPTATGDDIKLILMGGAVKDTLVEGSTKTYTIDVVDYEVTVDFVDANSAKFTINGEGTRDLLDGETDKLADGTTVGVSEILYQDYAGGVHQVEFFIGAQKLELKDTEITDADSSNSLKVDDDTIDDAVVIIEGSDDNSTFKIDRIHINMTADDDFFVPAGGKLSENPDLDESEVLFTNNWDIEYRGLSDELTEEIRLTTSGNKKYKLKFKDGGGNEVSLPIIEAVAASNLEFGEKDKALINAEAGNVTKDDYLILTDSTENRGERKSYVLQYKGADKLSADSPVLKFKDLGSGDTIEQSYTNSSPLATLKIGGADYRVFLGADADASNNDFYIQVDMDASGALNTVVNDTVNLTTWYGMEIGIENATQLSTTEYVIVSFKTPDNTRDGGSTQDNVETLQATDYVVNLSVNSNTKVALATLNGYTAGQGGTALNERTPDGETDVQYSYTSYGAFITRESPSSEPGTVKIEYPKAQREAVVYITTKGTSFSAAAAASSGAVTVQRIDVGATKLASEVPDINAVNSILVGGPCANAASATVLGNPADCTAGFEPGVGKVELYDVGTGNVAMLVAGFAAEDTRNAAAVVANSGDYSLSGAKMEVRKVGTTLTVAEPSVAAPAADAGTE